jgi:pimeloyl-ACP methyl ester carboxylesterase
MIATVNGTRIAYSDEGSGFPLIFLHGSPLTRRIWSKQVEALKAQFRVIAPDLRGFGESEGLSNPVSLDDLAKDIHALMEHLVTGPAILAGQALGGLVALAFAMGFPRYLRGLVLVGMGAGGASSAPAETFRASIEASAGLVADRPGPLDQSHIAGLAERLRVPTLVIAGTEDALVAPSHSVALAEAIPGAQLNLIPKAGHLVALEQPEAFNAVVTNWLAWGSNPRQGLRSRLGS